MTKRVVYGTDTDLLFAPEITYGTPVDGAGGGVYRRVSFKAYEVGEDVALGKDPILGQIRADQGVFHEPGNVDGSMIVPNDVEGLGFWLRYILGLPVTTGAGPFVHVYTPASMLESLTAQIGFTQINPARYLQHAGIKLGGMNFSMQRGGLAQFSIPGIFAQSETEQVAALDASPLEYVLEDNLFTNSSGTIKKDTVEIGLVTGGTFNFTNNLDPVLTLSEQIEDVQVQTASFDGDVTIRMSSDTALDVAANTKAAFELDFGFIKGADSINYNAKRVKFGKPKKPVPGPAGVEITYPFMAEHDTTAGTILTATLTNSIASY